MFKLKAFCLVLGSAVILSSCAGSYHHIYPRTLQYNRVSAAEAPVEMGYRYGVLSERGNKKFARKEEKKNLQLTAIQITNNTDRPLVFGTDIMLTSNGLVTTPLPQPMVYKALKQQAPLFLLYLLLTPSQITTSRSDGYVTTYNSFPIGLILGPGLALGNMLVASGNNQKFEQELIQNNLVGRVIEPGETVHGLVGLGNTQYAPLSVKIVEETAPPTLGRQ